jgi:hypothetical protein
MPWCGPSVLEAEQMSIFSDKPRHRSTPQLEVESIFEFLDTADVPAYAIFRDLVNLWTAALPAAVLSDIKGRMRSGRDDQFHSAMCEVMIHATLRCLGHKVDAHPAIAGATKPDFLAYDCAEPRNPLAYLEVTTVPYAQGQASKTKLRDSVADAINRAAVPPSTELHLFWRQVGSIAPPTRKLVSEIEMWASSTAVGGELPLRVGDWALDVGLHLRDSKRLGIGAIGSDQWDFSDSASPNKIIRALDAKAKAYGELSRPFVLVVADTRDEWDRNSHPAKSAAEIVLDDLLPQKMVLDYGRALPWQERQDAFWIRNCAPRHQRVSAVLMLPDPHPRRLRRADRQPILAVNPWASHTIPTDFLSLPRFMIQNDRWVYQPGRWLADVLALPEGWPPARCPGVFGLHAPPCGSSSISLVTPFKFP